MHDLVPTSDRERAENKVKGDIEGRALSAARE